MEPYPIHKLPDYFVTDYLHMVIPKPKQLFVRGIFPNDPHYVFLTVVGSRNCSSYGRDVCTQLIKGLKGYPIVIVSGLAVGIDTIAHESAIQAGLITIAFPGSGLGEHTIYPRSNMHLVEKILISGGCLISELDEKTSGNSWTFPARNRLMAGISKATLLIEGSHTSGSRITARLATEYNRDVLAVPGNITHEFSEAPNALIRLGAVPITCSSDILEALGFQTTQTPPLSLFPICTPEEELILKKLPSPKNRGELIRELGLPIHQVNALISRMEMKGLIKEEMGEIRRG